MNSELRKNCPMRHNNGNCMPAGGFCTAVNKPICEALHNAYDTGRCANVMEIKYGYNASQMNPVDEFTCSECGFTCTDYSQVKYDEDGDYTYLCECEFKYCPNCGAKMDRRRYE